ncbi:MAG: MopE-related protein [Myxococcota bacterium]
MAMMSCPACAELTEATCLCAHCGAKLGVCSPRGSVGSAAAVLMGLALTGCDKVGPQPDYGIPETGYFDEDADGYSPRDGDCDDTDASIHPDATETPGDGVDSDCDGDDDT